MCQAPANREGTPRSRNVLCPRKSAVASRSCWPPPSAPNHAAPTPSHSDGARMGRPPPEYIPSDLRSFHPSLFPSLTRAAAAAPAVVSSPPNIGRAAWMVRVKEREPPLPRGGKIAIGKRTCCTPCAPSHLAPINAVAAITGHRMETVLETPLGMH